MDTPKTRYPRSADGTFIAFRVFGNGPDLLVARPWISHLELFWEDRTWDRGSALSRSSRTSSPWISVASGFDHPVRARGDLGAICPMFAATYPERTLGLLLWAGMPCGGHEADYPWNVSQEERDRSAATAAGTASPPGTA